MMEEWIIMFHTEAKVKEGSYGKSISFRRCLYW